MSIITAIKHWLGVGELPPVTEKVNKDDKRVLELLAQYERRRLELLELAVDFPLVAKQKLQDEYHQIDRMAKTYMDKRPDLSEDLLHESKRWVKLWCETPEILQKIANQEHAKKYHAA